MTVYGPKLAKMGKNGRILGLPGHRRDFNTATRQRRILAIALSKSGQMRTDLAQITKNSAKLGCGGP